MIREFRPEENLFKNAEAQMSDIGIVENQISSARNSVEKEFAKGVNTWDQCVRTVLSIIQGHIQMAQGLEITESYALHVMDKIHKINEQLKDIDPLDIAYPRMPDEAVQQAIYQAIEQLKPGPKDIL